MTVPRNQIVVLLLLALCSVLPCRAADWKFPPSDRIVAIGDIHGDLDALVLDLKGRGLIDEQGAWIGGKTTVVFAGDMCDRGPDTRYIMDYVADLRKQAAAQGGQVFPLIGNHELMTAQGDVRYTSKAEFDSFQGYSGNFKGADPKAWIRIKAMHADAAANPVPAQPLTDATPDTEDAPLQDPATFDGYGRAMFGNSPYAKDIRGRSAIVQIGDTLFLHGGVGPWLLKYSPNQINEMIRSWIAYSQGVGPKPPASTSWVIEDHGPLWSRETAFGKMKPEVIDAIMKKYGLKRIVLGHTVQKAIVANYDGKVVLIDTANSRVMKGRLSSLEIQGDKLDAQYPERGAQDNPLTVQLLVKYGQVLNQPNPSPPDQGPNCVTPPQPQSQSQPQPQKDPHP